MTRRPVPTVLAVLVAVAVAVAGCGGDDRSADPSVGAPSTASAPASSIAPAVPSSGPDASSTAPASDAAVPEGFERVGARVHPPGDEPPCDVCLWLADTNELRQRGLMGVTDLGGLDGMAFVYAEPRTTSFTMRNTLIELSIVFYGDDGSHLDAFDMVPCEDEPCPSYPTPDDFTVAIEVPRGGLDALGMRPGSRLELTGDCA